MTLLCPKQSSIHRHRLLLLLDLGEYEALTLAFAPKSDQSLDRTESHTYAKKHSAMHHL